MMRTITESRQEKAARQLRAEQLGEGLNPTNREKWHDDIPAPEHHAPVGYSNPFFPKKGLDNEGEVR